jgi:hypothetical protein
VAYYNLIAIIRGKPFLLYFHLAMPGEPTGRLPELTPARNPGIHCTKVKLDA